MENKSSPKRKYNFFLVTLTFFLQYLFQGFIFGIKASIIVTLKEKGVSYGTLGIMGLANSAAYLKIVFGPITDLYYINAIGRRMTYITFCGIAIAAFALYSSFYIEGWIEDTDIVSLGIMNFIMAMLVWLQDVTIDSLAGEYLEEADLKYAITMQTLGQGIGPLMTSQVFFLFSSEKWTKETFGMETPLLNYERVYALFAVWIILTTILSNIVFSDEGSGDSDDMEADNEGKVLDLGSTMKIARMMLKTILTKNWLTFIGICWMQRLGNNFFEGTFRLKMLESPHIDKETFAGVDSQFLPIELIIMFSVSLLAIERDTMSWMKWSNIIRFMNNFGWWAMMYRYPYTPENADFYYYYRYVYLLGRTLNKIEFTAMVFFYTSRADNRFKSSAMSLIACAMNMSHTFYNVVFQSVQDYVPYEVMAIGVTSVYLSFMAVVYGPVSRKLENLDEKDFRCSVPSDWMIELKDSGIPSDVDAEHEEGLDKKYKQPVEAH